MAFRFTIGRRVGVGFISLIFLTFVAFWLTLVTLNNSRDINDKISNQYTPSVSALQELNNLVIRSKMLITNWVNVQNDNEDKNKLKILIKDEYPALKKKLNALALEWNKDDKESITDIFNLLDALFENHKYCELDTSNIVHYHNSDIYRKD